MALAVHTPKTLKDDEAQTAFRAHNADAAVVVAYGLILPKPILEAPRARLLQPARLAAAALARRRAHQPRHHGGRCRERRHHHEDGRGARHRRHGDGGAHADRCRHDGGRTARCLVAPRRRSDAARARGRGARLASRSRRSRQAGVTYAEKISKNETRIDWTKPWKQVHDHIRGLSPFPGAWFELDGVRVKVLRSTKGEGSGAPGTVLDDKLTIACGDGAVRLTQVQRAGKQPMTADEFLRGTPVKAGARVA